jgi:pyruvate kinase
MTLFWGIMPHHVENLENPEKLIEKVTQWGVARGMLVPGDRVVYVTGTGVLMNTHNLLVVHEVPPIKS